MHSPHPPHEPLHVKSRSSPPPSSPHPPPTLTHTQGHIQELFRKFRRWTGGQQQQQQSWLVAVVGPAPLPGCLGTAPGALSAARSLHRRRSGSAGRSERLPGTLLLLWRGDLDAPPPLLGPLQGPLPAIAVTVGSHQSGPFPLRYIRGRRAPGRGGDRNR